MNRKEQRLELERQVLCTVLNHSNTYYEVAAIISEQSFLEEKHGVVWKGVDEMMKAGDTSLDILVLHGSVAKGGVSVTLLSELYSGLIPKESEVRKHAAILKGYELMGRVVLESLKLHEEAKHTYEPQEVIDQVVKLGDELTGKLRTNVNRSNADILLDVEQTLDNRAKGRIGESLTKLIGYKPSNGGRKAVDVDKKLVCDGGELIIVAGRPGMGKSVVANTILKNYGIDQEKKVLFWSLEMSDRQVMERLMSAVSGIHFDNFKYGTIKLTSDEYQTAQRAIKESPVRIYDKPGVTVSEIRAEAMHLYHTGGLDCLIIDHGGLVQLERSRGQSEVDAIGDVSSTLKRLSKEMNIPVILLWQLSRGVESRADKKPVLSDLRGSGRLEEDADKVLMLYRPEYYMEKDDPDLPMYEGKMTWFLHKNRNGDTDHFTLEFDYRHMVVKSSAVESEAGSPKPEVKELPRVDDHIPF